MTPGTHVSTLFHQPLTGHHPRQSLHRSQRRFLLCVQNLVNITHIQFAKVQQRIESIELTLN